MCLCVHIETSIYNITYTVYVHICFLFFFSLLIKVVKVLGELKADLNTTDNDGFTPAYVAAEYNHFNVLRALGEYQDSAEMGKAAKSGNTPAHIAAENDNYEALKVLYELKQDLLAVNLLGETPAFLAAKSGHVDTLKLIVELYTQENKNKNNNDEKEISGDDIEDSKSYDIVLKSKASDGTTIPVVAAMNGHYYVIRYLLEKKCLGYPYFTSNGWSPLFAACYGGHAKIISKLLKHARAKPDLNINNKSSSSSISSKLTEEDIIEYLNLETLSNHLDVHEGTTPLAVAKLKGHHDVEDLINNFMNERNKNINKQNNDEISNAPSSPPTLTSNPTTTSSIIIPINRSPESSDIYFE